MTIERIPCKSSNKDQITDDGLSRNVSGKNRNLKEGGKGEKESRSFPPTSPHPLPRELARILKCLK